ncbi:MAG: response regulator [Proteobacteria bacterium]|nr:response regulator [Pseudomonadota bacterium]
MKKVRVLFADDEQGLVSAVVRRLTLRNIIACGVTSILDALRKMDEEIFDVAVLDVRMPDIGGLDVLRRFRNKYPDVEVILLSGHGSVENVEEAERLGAFEYLQKPVEIEDLVSVIHEAAAKSGRAQHE